MRNKKKLITRISREDSYYLMRLLNQFNADMYAYTAPTIRSVITYVNNGCPGACRLNSSSDLSLEFCSRARDVLIISRYNTEDRRLCTERSL
uniref:Uncharacterized protein n=1 Tax=Trichogramma kaykai TaxID=54128 RepID=A0ABD2VVI8_9HYME